MASFSLHTSIIKCANSITGYKQWQQTNRGKNICIKNHGKNHNSRSAVETIGDKLDRREGHSRHVNPTPHSHGLITEGEVRSRHTITIRSYEVGADGTATIETLLNLLQETGLNHTRMTGLCGGGFGLTVGMIRHNLIWVISRMQVQVHRYPIWDEIIDIDVWLGASGKHGMRSECILRNHSTGHALARATSKWAMMNWQTRRLSKMPDEVRAEISPWFSENHALQDQDNLPVKIEKLDRNAQHVYSGLKARWSDMDMNQHVNNVKYVRWMLEPIPDKFMKNHQLSDISIEFKRECGISDVIESQCEPRAEDNEFLENGFSLPLTNTDGKGWPCYSYIHLLQTEVDSKSVEIVRGRTTWKRKHQPSTTKVLY